MTVRKTEAIRDRVMAMCGTDEPLIDAHVFPPGYEHLARTLQWRKPLSIVEINRMAPTAEVRARPGRP